MTTEDTQEKAALKAYSEGAIGWRQACKELVLMDIGELHDALAEAGLPLPEGDVSDVDEVAVGRFAEFLTKKDE